jgi:hypothetical protein
MTMLRRICRAKGDEVMRGWRKLHNEKLRNFYSSRSIIRMIREREMCRRCSTNGGKAYTYRILVEKPEGKND